ncbi:hypothetical protein D3C84_442520 [compost metagenome]
MHHIGVAFDHHLLGELDRAGAGNAADIIAAQVDQHQVLGQLLGVGEQVFLQGAVGFFSGTARTGTGDRAHGDQAILDPHQHLRRATDYVEVAEVEEVHVGGGVEAAQGTVEIDGRGLEGDRHALGDHHLHAVAGQDVFLDLPHCLLVILAGEAGAEVRFAPHRQAGVHAEARHHWLTQLLPQQGQACLALLEGIGLARIDQDDGVQLAGQVVEHDHRIRDHQQDVRGAQRIGVRAVGQALFHITHAVVAEVAHQSAVEARQAGDRRHLIALLEGFDEGQRVFAVVAFHLGVIDADADFQAMGAQHGTTLQADDGVTAPLLAALHRLQQVGVRGVGELQVEGQGRVEIRQGLERKRNAVIAFGGQTQEFFAGHDQPRGQGAPWGLLEMKASVCKRAGGPGQNELGAPAPTGDGLDDLHSSSFEPMLAGNNHVSVSLRRIVGGVRRH